LSENSFTENKDRGRASFTPWKDLGKKKNNIKERRGKARKNRRKEEHGRQKSKGKHPEKKEISPTNGRLKRGVTGPPISGHRGGQGTLKETRYHASNTLGRGKLRGKKRDTNKITIKTTEVTCPITT